MCKLYFNGQLYKTETRKTRHLKRVPAFLYSFKLTLDGTDIFKQWRVYETGRQKEEDGKRLVRDISDSVNIICTQKTGGDHKNSRVK